MNVGSEKLATASKVILGKSRGQLLWWNGIFFNFGKVWQFRDQEFFVLFNKIFSKIHFRLFKVAKIKFQFFLITTCQPEMQILYFALIRLAHCITQS